MEMLRLSSFLPSNKPIDQVIKNFNLFITQFHTQILKYVCLTAQKKNLVAKKIKKKTLVRMLRAEKFIE